jgi:hypothetical protein
MTNFFQAKSQLVFLHYRYKDSDEAISTFGAGRTISLHAGHMEICEPIAFDDLFDAVQLEHTLAPKDATNLLSNLIAAETRRGAGNIVLVGTNEMADAIGTLPAWDRPKPIVLEHLAPNEIRVAYWRLKWDAKDVELGVDGGVQEWPGGYSKLPNYRSYFKRCFL